MTLLFVLKQEVEAPYETITLKRQGMAKVFPIHVVLGFFQFSFFSEDLTYLPLAISSIPQTGEFLRVPCREAVY